MYLVHSKTGKQVALGDSLESFRGDKYVLVKIIRPRGAGSTGRVCVLMEADAKGLTLSQMQLLTPMEYYPGVFGLEWRGRGDQGPEAREDWSTGAYVWLCANEHQSLTLIKQGFWSVARTNDVPDDQIPQLWARAMTAYMKAA